MGATVVSALFAVIVVLWKLVPLATLILLVLVSNRLYRIEQKFQKKKDRD